MPYRIRIEITCEDGEVMDVLDRIDDALGDVTVQHIYCDLLEGAGAAASTGISPATAAASALPSVVPVARPTLLRTVAN
jgi:hypothetical protein